MCVCVWIGRNRIQFNLPTMIEWLWVLLPPSLKDLPALIKTEIVLLYLGVVHNLGVFLDSQFLLNEAFAQFQLVYQLHPFMDWEANHHLIPLFKQLCLGHLICSLLQCALYETALEEHLEATDGPKCNGTVMGKL